MARLQVCVLGSLQILVDGRPVSLESDKARALLIYLAVESGRAHRRARLIGLLWPDSPEDFARATLRQALYSLRQAIGDAAANPPFLLVTRDEIQFNRASEHALDVAAFTASLDLWVRHSHAQGEICSSCAESLREAVAQYRGRFLDQFFLRDSAEFEEWALMERESLHRRALEALERLSDYHLSRSEHEEARRYAQRQLELDPWREEAHRQLMLSLAEAGQRSAALMQYEACRKALREELGIEPCGATRELYDRICRGETGTSRVQSSYAPHSAPQPLPAPVTPFVGRERELSELAQLLNEPGCRLVTLVGPGGMGKTRLAVELATRSSPAFSDGAAFIPLAPVSSPSAILPTVAGALGLPLYGSGDPEPQILAFLRDRCMLLVVDNFEQLLDAAGLWEKVLAAASCVKLLVTSRESLSLQEEWVFEVEGLPVPESELVEDLEACEAAVLFLQRARRARVGFELRPDERPALARLCRLVDGIPLALELAATWVRVLSVAETVQEIEGNLGALAAPVRDLPDRHRSMRAVFEQSWKMLAPDEQTVMSRLSVFRGGFVREAAEEIAGASLSVLAALVTKSLLRRMASGRYGVHELVRQYAAEKLDADPLVGRETRERHSLYYLKMLQAQDAALHSGRQREALAELSAEIDNLRAAWNWAVSFGDAAPACRVAVTFWYVIELLNWLAEGEAIFGQSADTLRARGEAGPVGGISRQEAVDIMLCHAAFFAFRRGKNEGAYLTLKSSGGRLRSSVDTRAQLYSLEFLGIVCWQLGRYAEARDAFQELRSKARAAGEPWFETPACEFLGIVNHELGEYGEARRCLTEAFGIAYRMGDLMLKSHALSYLCRTLVALGEHAEAERLLHEGLALARAINYRNSEGLTLIALGEAARASKQHDDAERYLADACRIFGEIEATLPLSRALFHRGLNALDMERFPGAESSLRESLRIASASDLAASQLDALAGLVQLAHRSPGHSPWLDGEGRARALEAAIRILAHPASTRQAKDLTAPLRPDLESSLGPDQIASAQERARSAPLDEFVRLCLAA